MNRSATPETRLRLPEGGDEVFPGVHIPLLEVLTGHRRRGIGGEIVCGMIVGLDGLYAVDLLRDPELQRSYASLGMRPTTGMMVRRYTNQSGTNPSGAIYWAHEGRARADQHHRR